MPLGTQFVPATVPDLELYTEPFDLINQRLQEKQQLQNLNLEALNQLNALGANLEYLDEDSQYAEYINNYLDENITNLSQMDLTSSEGRAQLHGLTREVQKIFSPRGLAGALRSRVGQRDALIKQYDEDYKDNIAVRDYARAGITPGEMDFNFRTGEYNRVAGRAGLVNDVATKDITEGLNKMLDNISADTLQSFGITGVSTLDGVTKLYREGKIDGITYDKVLNSLASQVPVEWLQSERQRALARGDQNADDQLNLFTTIKDANGDDVTTPNMNSTIGRMIHGASYGKKYRKETADHFKHTNELALYQAKRLDDEVEAAKAIYSREGVANIWNESSLQDLRGKRINLRRSISLMEEELKKGGLDPQIARDLNSRIHKANIELELMDDRFERLDGAVNFTDSEREIFNALSDLPVYTRVMSNEVFGAMTSKEVLLDESLELLGLDPKHFGTETAKKIAILEKQTGRDWSAKEAKRAFGVQYDDLRKKWKKDSEEYIKDDETFTENTRVYSAPPSGEYNSLYGNLYREAQQDINTNNGFGYSHGATGLSVDDYVKKELNLKPGEFTVEFGGLSNRVDDNGTPLVELRIQEKDGKEAMSMLASSDGTQQLSNALVEDLVTSGRIDEARSIRARMIVGPQIQQLNPKGMKVGESKQTVVNGQTLTVKAVGNGPNSKTYQIVGPGGQPINDNLGRARLYGTVDDLSVGLVEAASNITPPWTIE